MYSELGFCQQGSDAEDALIPYNNISLVSFFAAEQLLFVVLLISNTVPTGHVTHSPLAFLPVRNGMYSHLIHSLVPGAKP